jgi:hypothetical protein
MANHLEELLKDTPMGRMKLLAAWDSLSTETQIRLLSEMSEKGRTRVTDRPIWRRALSSPSEYVRYLAAREIRLPRDNEIENQVMSDSSPLVRYSGTGGRTLLGQLSNEDFDRWPKALKLTIVSSDDPPEAVNIARWVEHAAENKSMSEDEICDVVLEYLCNPEALRLFQESSYDFFVDTKREEGFNALWRLLPKVPSSVAYCLVGRLPWRALPGGSAEPPREVLTWLETSPYLESLLWRKDAPLLELRRKIFFSTDPRYDRVKPAAVSNNFYVDLGELHDLFKQNSKLLRTLVVFAQSLSPVMLLALGDSVWKQGGPVESDDARFCEEHFESALAKLKGGDLHSPYGRDQEIRFLKVYWLANIVRDWTGTEPYLDALPEPLKFLGDKVVKGDTWGTFLAFAKEIASDDPKFDDLLPRLEDLNRTRTDVIRAKFELDHGPTSSARRLRWREGGFNALWAGDKQDFIDAATPAAKSPQGSSLLGNTIAVLGILAALLTFLFAVGGIIDNEYRNFDPGVIAMAISAGVIVFAGSHLLRRSK